MRPTPALECRRRRPGSFGPAHCFSPEYLISAMHSRGLRILLGLAALTVATAWTNRLLTRPHGCCFSMQSAAHMRLLEIQRGLELYTLEIGHLPSGDTSAVFTALRSPTPGHPGLISRPMRTTDDGRIELDPWGTPLRITVLGDSASIASAGPDRRFASAVSTSSDDLVLFWRAEQ